MLLFAALVPHPPIIIPEIGEENIKFATKTIDSMKQLAKDIEKQDVDTVIFVSPHTTLSPEHMLVSYAKEAEGNLDQFGHEEISYKLKIDMDLAEKVVKFSQKSKIPVRISQNSGAFTMDHGILVPLYYLRDSLPSDVEIIVVGFSGLTRAEHFTFGQSIKEAANKSNKNVILISSGDLSHRILEEGSEFIGKKFDSTIEEAIADYNPKKILEIDEFLQEDAGECGYRSLLILLGAMDGLTVKSKVLSYEAPFGVGYMVAKFNSTQ